MKQMFPFFICLLLIPQRRFYFILVYFVTNFIYVYSYTCSVHMMITFVETAEQCRNFILLSFNDLKLIRSEERTLLNVVFIS